MDITPEDFERFLNWLDPDRDRAIAKYQVVRVRLERYFACKGCGVDSEEVADETMARVAKKVAEIGDSYVGERLRYFIGVARNVYLEWLKRPKPIPLAVDPIEPPQPLDEGDEKELLDRCLERCLSGLSEKDRDLILRYYVGEKSEKIAARKKLADEYGLAPNALRIRAHRIRTDLRSCLEKCVEKDNDDEENARKITPVVKNGLEE